MKAKLYTDGGSRGNPGPSASAYILETIDGMVIDVNSRYIAHEETNNVAEYTAMIMGLIAARRHGVTELFVFSDSELMVRQLQGVYKVKDDKLKELAGMAFTAMSFFDFIEFTAIKREDNTTADQLVNQVLDEGWPGKDEEGQ